MCVCETNMSSNGALNSKSGKSTIKGMKSLIEQFCAVTGSEENVARQVIESCNGNIEMAINMHMESQPQMEPQISSSVNETEDSSIAIRPPIPQKQDKLVEEAYSYGFRGRRRAPRSVFDGFRDFQKESKYHEEMINGEPSISSKKRKTLEDLFRPPLDLMHRGSFETAKELGKKSLKWLMINIQDAQEFSCQILNRDLWSKQVVKNIIKDNFIFWQVYQDSEEGRRYCQFYKLNKFPYIAVLDPRTGENLIVWNKVDELTFCDLVTDFLSTHDTLNTNSTLPPVKEHSNNIIEASEEAQLEAALAASLKESASSHPEENDQLSSSESDFGIDDCSNSSIANSSKSDILPENNDSKISESWKDFTGPNDDPKCSLVLRYADGKKGNLTLSLTSKLKAVILFAESEGYPEKNFELITNFPKRNLSDMNENETLNDLELSHREIIFVQAKSNYEDIEESR
ncbi:UBX domain-containing protein 7 [Nymphon striatum]|nr:UBX domain-containing protein 7 [Nymphon striatum]